MMGESLAQEMMPDARPLPLRSCMHSLLAATCLRQPTGGHLGGARGLVSCLRPLGQVRGVSLSQHRLRARCSYLIGPTIARKMGAVPHPQFGADEPS
jgi:hypothetical protein